MVNKEEQAILWVCKNRYKSFLGLKNVVGLGLGKKYINNKNTNKVCIQVLVRKKEPLCKLCCKDVISKQYMQIVTDVIEVGDAEAYALTNRIRPAQCGYGIGMVNKFTAGTLGCIVERGSGNNMEYFLLSSNHIIANYNRAAIGTRILQPSLIDGGRTRDVIATLSEFIPLSFGRLASNLADCAIAKITDNSKISNKIAWAGYPTGVNSAIVGERVKKVGSTTGRTSGLVRTVGTTLLIRLDGQATLFQNQIVLERMSEVGDSGSVILNENNEAVGLLMGGSPSMTIANDFRTVLNLLNVKLTY